MDLRYDNLVCIEGRLLYIMGQIPAHYIELVSDALLKVYWFKKSFRNAIRRAGVAESFLATWAADETKRDLLERLVLKLEANDLGIRVLNRLADSVLEQRTFPDPERVEDSKFKIEQAKQALAALREYKERQTVRAQDERERIETQRRGRERRQEAQERQHQLAGLSERLNTLAKRIGTDCAGYEFEEWSYDLMDYFEVDNRRPYKVDGRQIDGSVTLEGTTYLVELKFTTDQSDAPDIDIFRSKVLSKADNTMGILVSISGYSSVAVREASRDKTPLLLFDYRHLYLLLTGSMRFPEMLSRVRRHSSQTGKAYLSIEDFGA